MNANLNEKDPIRKRMPVRTAIALWFVCVIPGIAGAVEPEVEVAFRNYHNAIGQARTLSDLDVYVSPEMRKVRQLALYDGVDKSTLKERQARALDEIKSRHLKRTIESITEQRRVSSNSGSMCLLVVTMKDEAGKSETSIHLVSQEDGQWYYGSPYRESSTNTDKGRVHVRKRPDGSYELERVQAGQKLSWLKTREQAEPAGNQKGDAQ